MEVGGQSCSRVNDYLSMIRHVACRQSMTLRSIAGRARESEWCFIYEIFIDYCKCKYSAVHCIAIGISHALSANQVREIINRQLTRLSDVVNAAFMMSNLFFRLLAGIRAFHSV